MHIIGQHQFVIETSVPTGNFKNKTVMSEEGPVTVPSEDPEYEWMWFAGVGLHPGMLAQGKAVPMNIWTPYPSQAARYKDKEEADIVNDKILTKAAGGIVVDYELSHWREGRQVVVPVNIPVVGADSKSGIDKNGRL